MAGLAPLLIGGPPVPEGQRARGGDAFVLGQREGDGQLLTAGPSGEGDGVVGHVVRHFKRVVPSDEASGEQEAISPRVLQD